MGSTAGQQHFIEGKSDGSNIITPSLGNHAIFTGEDGYLRCKDSAGVVEHLLTEGGERIHCAVYP